MSPTITSYTPKRDLTARPSIGGTAGTLQRGWRRAVARLISLDGALSSETRYTLGFGRWSR
jgi:hypothetical protein